MYVRLKNGGEWSARVEEVNGQAVTLYECVDSETGEVCWLPADRFAEGRASTGSEDSVLDRAEAQVRQVFGPEVKQEDEPIDNGPPQEWFDWQPDEVEVPWWTTRAASIAAFVACYCAGAPLSMLTFSSGPLFGPVPPSAIVGGVVVTVGWVGAFAGFFAFQRRSVPWVPVRAEVKEEVSAGSAEEVRQVLSDMVKDLRAGKIKTSAANSIMKAALLQVQVAEHSGGLAGVLRQESKVQGAAVKRWVNGRGFVQVQRGGRRAWHCAEEYGWQGG